MMFNLFGSRLNRKITMWMILIALTIIVIAGAVMVISERNSLVAVEGIFKETMAKQNSFIEESLSARGDEDNENLLASLQDKGYALAELMAVIGIEPLRSRDADILDQYVLSISKNRDVVYALYLDEKGNILTHSLPEPEGKIDLMNIIRPIELSGVRLGTVKIGLSKKSIGKQMLYSQQITAQTVAMGREGMNDSLRILEKNIRNTIQKRILFLVSLSIISFLAVVSIMSVILNRTILTQIKKLHKTSEKIIKGNLDARIEMPAVPCWVELKCKSKDCPARAEKDTPCWYVVGSMRSGEIQGTSAEKIQDCMKCEVYKRHAGDEIQQLGGAFNLMIANLKEARGNLEEKIRVATEDVKKKNIELESVNKELEAFSYSVSHDLRAPLRGIDGWSQALLEDYGGQLDEQGQTYINRVRSETQHMGALIDDLIQLSRLTRAEMRMEQIDLSTVAQTIASRLNETQPERQVEFIIQPGLRVKGDAGLLEAALTNLLDNAFKFTGKIPQACIEFGQTEIRAEPVFFVRDNGVGFDMAYAKKLFGAFQRMHPSSEFPGTGVGLATVQRIIHRHGGRVWAESKVGQGATFFFTLEEIK